MSKVSSAVVSKGVQKTTPFSRARQSAKAMLASTKPSPRGQGWNVSWSAAMARVMASLLSKKENDHPHERPQATLGMRSRSITATGSSWMPAGGQEMSRPRVITSNSNRTNSQTATNNSGKSSPFSLPVVLSCHPPGSSTTKWTAIHPNGLSVPTGSPRHCSHAAVSYAWCRENATVTDKLCRMAHFPENPRHFFRDDGRTPTWEEYYLGGSTGERTQWYSNAIDEGLNEWCSSPADKKIPVYSGEVVRFQFAKVCEHWTSERNGQGKPRLLMVKIHGVDGRKDDLVPCESDGFWWWCDIPARCVFSTRRDLCCQKLTYNHLVILGALGKRSS